jgi:hypothetical protein
MENYICGERAMHAREGKWIQNYGRIILQYILKKQEGGK